MFLLVTFTPGVLPFALRARLRRFKFAPGEFVFAVYLSNLRAGVGEPEKREALLCAGERCAACGTAG